MSHDAQAKARAWLAEHLESVTRKPGLNPAKASFTLKFEHHGNSAAARKKQLLLGKLKTAFPLDGANIPSSRIEQLPHAHTITYRLTVSDQVSKFLAGVETRRREEAANSQLTVG